jgi:hypothetical protein
MRYVVRREARWVGAEGERGGGAHGGQWGEGRGGGGGVVYIVPVEVLELAFTGTCI